MRESLPLVPFAVLLLSACVSKVGNGQLQQESKNVVAFTELDVGSGLELSLQVGPAQSVDVAGDSNLLPDLEVQVHGQALSIQFPSGYQYQSNLRIRATVAVPTLTRLDLSGGTTGDGSGIAGTDFALDLSGASSAHLHGSVGQLTVDASGASELSGADLASLVVKVNASGASTVETLASQEADVEASGASHITVHGNPTVRNVNSSGASTVTFPQ